MIFVMCISALSGALVGYAIEHWAPHLSVGAIAVTLALSIGAAVAIEFYPGQS